MCGLVGERVANRGYVAFFATTFPRSVPWNRASFCIAPSSSGQWWAVHDLQR
jgi:hypothetical protein